MSPGADAIAVGPTGVTHVASQHGEFDALRGVVPRPAYPSSITVVGTRDGATSQVSASTFNPPNNLGEQHATPQDHSLRSMKDLMPQSTTDSANAWGMLVFVKEKKTYGISNFIRPLGAGRRIP